MPVSREEETKDGRFNKMAQLVDLKDISFVKSKLITFFLWFEFFPWFLNNKRFTSSLRLYLRLTLTFHNYVLHSNKQSDYNFRCLTLNAQLQQQQQQNACIGVTTKSCWIFICQFQFQLFSTILCILKID